MGPALTHLFLSSQSDERLVSLARGGHERAFSVIVERYRAELEAFARQNNSDGRAEDIVQQAFLGAFAALGSGAAVRHLRGWLYQVVRNEAVRVRPTAELPLEGVAACGEPLEDVVQRRELALSALSELTSLTTHQREALVATALRGSSRAEVARTMGLSEGAVRQLIHRARTTLRSAVTALTPYPLAQFLAASGSGATSDASLTAGAAGAGGVAVKLGTLIASGVVATGIATVEVSTGEHRPTPPPPPAAVVGHANHHRTVAPGAGPAAQAPTGAGDNRDDRDAGPGDNHQGENEQVCATISPGMVVHEAELQLVGGGAFWEEVELVS